MCTFITKLEEKGAPRLAVKDLVDVRGSITTAGSRAVAAIAEPANEDAACLKRARAKSVAIVGKANLHELAFGAAGVNEWFGTPRNPLDPRRVPGGSSSGSAVAVATEEADLALGTDTGGSIRVPAAFCGVAGLKTTHRRTSLEGVWPLAPRLDTVGPMAKDVAGLRVAMALLDDGFRPLESLAPTGLRIGRLFPEGESVDPEIDEVVDRAVAESGLEFEAVRVDQWGRAFEEGTKILYAGAVESNSRILTDPHLYSLLSEPVRRRLEEASRVSQGELEVALDYQVTWQETWRDLFCRFDAFVLPAVGFLPPLLEEAYQHTYTRLTMPVNLAGLPAAVVPVRVKGLSAGIQVIGAWNQDELCLAVAEVLEGAARSMSS
jgi:amidase